MKALLLALPIAALVAGQALADDPIEKQVLITATVPTASFYVEPVGGNWMNDPQDMAWNSFQGTLTPVRKQLQAKSTIGPITAHLLSPAVVSSGLDAIDLDVKIGDTVLTTNATEILSAAAAAPGAIVDFEVAPQVPAGGYKPGAYQGLVSMMFETAVP
ncbi:MULTISPECIES: CS1 type fimbrial major subunit [Pseudomonas]|uniref:CS1 type fimbrial major subunit n=1 Tax=Pseudomonas TaxID=286 RepID=UPI00061DFB00|nr:MULTISPECIES: CS1 type fimbrial major subunit [Pseudomonas]KIY39265.1 adhesin [Pseudomonas sp. 10-1B]MEB6591074.1 fimbrial protein [Pseudomonas asiatica]